MKCNYNIDFLRKTVSIEKQSSTYETEYKAKTIFINRLIEVVEIEKITKNIFIDKAIYRVIRVNIPFFSDWVILQNEYLPVNGEYFLN